MDMMRDMYQNVNILLIKGDDNMKRIIAESMAKANEKKM